MSTLAKRARPSSSTGSNTLKRRISGSTSSSGMPTRRSEAHAQRRRENTAPQRRAQPQPAVRRCSRVSWPTTSMRRPPHNWRAFDASRGTTQQCARTVDLDQALSPLAVRHSNRVFLRANPRSVSGCWCRLCQRASGGSLTLRPKLCTACVRGRRRSGRAAQGKQSVAILANDNNAAAQRRSDATRHAPPWWRSCYTALWSAHKRG